MLIGRLSIILMILAIAVGSVAGAFVEKPQVTWHAPETNPERALDRILKLVDRDRNKLDNLSNVRGAKSSRRTIDYEPVLIPPLIAPTRGEEPLHKNYVLGYLEGDAADLPDTRNMIAIVLCLVFGIG
jgi:hypothetical protein